MEIDGVVDNATQPSQVLVSTEGLWWSVDDIMSRGASTPGPWTADPPTPDPDLDPSNVVAEQIVHFLRIYMPIIVLILGVPGNILSYIIMSRPQFNQTTSSLYLRALAVGDTCYILFFILQRQILGWGLRTYLSNYPNVFQGYCGFFHFSAYTPKIFGMYTIIVMTYDRMLGIVFPLKAKRWSTRRSALIGIGIIALVAVIESSPRIAVQTSKEFATWLCPYFLSMNIFRVYVRYYYVHSLICGSLVLVANTIIITILIKSARNRRKLMGENVDKIKGQNTRNRRVTVMLTMVSFFYVFALVLSCFHYQFWPYAPEQWKKQIGWRKFSHEVALLFEYLNYSINFWLYVFSCSKFRLAVRELFTPGVRAGAMSVYVASSKQHNESSSETVKSHVSKNKSDHKDIKIQVADENDIKTRDTVADAPTTTTEDKMKKGDTTNGTTSPY